MDEKCNWLIEMVPTQCVTIKMEKEVNFIPVVVIICMCVCAQCQLQTVPEY